jgi:hypothetical protein
MAADEDEATGPAGGNDSRASDKAAEQRRAAQRQRPSVTIDLSAEEIKEKPAGVPKAEPRRESGQRTEQAFERRSGDTSTAAPRARMSAAARALAPDDAWRRGMFAGVAGGLAALIFVVLLQALGILPAPGRSVAYQAAEQARTASETSAALDGRVAAIETMTEGLPAMRTDLKALGDRVAALEAGQRALAPRSAVDEVAAGVAELRSAAQSAQPSATREDIAALTERIARLEVAAAAGVSGDAVASSEAFTSLTGQLTAADAQLRALADRVAAAEAKVAASSAVTGGGPALRAVAIAALRRAAEGGEPFAADVDLVAALGIAGAEVSTLRPIAEKGVPTSGEIAAEFPAVADAVIKAATSGDPNAGFWQRVANGLGSLVTIRPTGPVAGSDPPAILSRMADAVQRGDLAAALAEREGLPQAGKDASAEWAAKAEARAGLDALVARIARAADTPTAG